MLHYYIIELRSARPMFLPYFKNSFPRIPEQDSHPDYRALFPWGCDQLEEDPQYTEGYYKILGVKSPYNIYLAIKYGVWSFPPQMYSILPEQKPKFYAFVWDCKMFGIARIIGFHPQKSFKYWQHSWDPSIIGFFGTIEIKFVKLGRLPYEGSINKFKKFDPEIKQYLQRMNPQQMDLHHFRSNDKYEEKKRNQMKQMERVQKFQADHDSFCGEFQKFRQEVQSKSSTGYGRQNYARRSLAFRKPEQNQTRSE